MNKTTNIAHPLKNRAGSSQGNRFREALSSQYAPIDGKTLGDRLYFIGQYARLISHYEVLKDQNQEDKAYQQTDNWSGFFENSLPFKLANFGKTSVADLENRFSELHKALGENPSAHTLEALLNFIYDKIILPASALYGEVQRAGNTFATRLLGIIKSSYQEPFKQFIALYNASAVFLCIPKKNFVQFMQPPWQLKVQKEIYALDPCIQQVKKGKTTGYLLAGEIAAGIFDQFLSGLAEIIEASPNYIQEGLVPLEASLQQKHEPHLALLFTFLELFKHVQGNINELGKKHLDFFYKNVLRLLPKEAVPDKAHLVFEIAKHLENGYVLPEGLLLKDGKDAKNQDIQFGLDQELVIDKAQITDLRSLSLYPIKENNDNAYIEGAYIAPDAKSLDGKGGKFKEKGASWATLSDKYSKQVLEGHELPEENPKARLGFVLSSPVLLLQEGKRKITISLDCKIRKGTEFTYTDIISFFEKVKNQKVFLLTQDLVDRCFGGLTDRANEHITSLLNSYSPFVIGDDVRDFLFQADLVSCVPFFEPEDRVIICECLIENSNSMFSSFFDISFSGEEGWVIPKPGNNLTMELTTNGVDNLNLTIVAQLDDDDPAVVFFNGDVLHENLPLEPPSYPAVKIEIDPEVKEKRLVFNCNQLGGDGIDIPNEDCCLKKEPVLEENIRVSVYHYFRNLILQDANINVEVCGVKNLIVQNDENLQDVNKPIMPFGPRPKVDASFIIGSKEVFCKHWDSFRLNLEWKDRPLNFNAYYEAYNQDPPPTITNTSFDIEASMLEDANWRANGTKKLFITKENFPPCPDVDLAFNYNGYVWNRGDFPIGYAMKSMPIDPLAPFNINSPKAFFRVQLKGEDFQHDRYAYVLAQQMLKLSRVADLIKMEDFLDDVDKGCDLATTTEGKVNTIEAEAAGGVGSNITQELIDQLLGTLLPFDLGLNDISDELKAVVCNLRTQIENITGGTLPVLPNEPYTPLIKSLSIDYQATALMNDMELVHLYPYENTSKHENIEEKPTLFPFFDDEGTLFIGLKEVTPGGNLSLLFQLAEATADSEQNRAKINWHYLSNNSWKLLLPDFDVISDTTDGLTVSGIVTIAVPGDIVENGHTILPDEMYWLKVSAPANVKAVAETIGIHTQAALAAARFGELSDLERLNTALPAGSITKPVNSDFNIKKVEQLYGSFGGRQPEASGHFYVRVSEHLKHKGRGVMITDYEKIILEAFPEIFKVKCISHTMGLSANGYRRDLEIAPGYLIIAVIPDLTKLKAGNLLTPKVPISLLEKIGEEIQKKTSPFARIKVMNPRYEPIDVRIEVRLYRGKSVNFYAKKLKEEISQFLAPWFLGDSEKLAFGQEVLFSDLVGFVEQRDYVDFILDIALKGKCGQNGSVIRPLTARSILTGGKICVEINEEKCADKVTNADVLIN